VLANLAVLGVAACFALVFRFATALFILFVGIALGMTVKPGVEWLRRRGVARWVGALAIYVALAVVAAGVLLLVAPVLVEQLGSLLSRAPTQVEHLREQLGSSSIRALHRAAAYLPDWKAPSLPMSVLLTYGAAIGRNVFTVAAVLLLGFFWTLEGDRRVRELAFFAPLERRRSIRAFLVEVERKVGAYVRGQSLVCLVIGVLAFAIYRLIGLPYALILGVIYAVGEAVPVVGPIVGTAAASLVALSVNPALVVWVIAAAAFLQLLENYLLIPRVMDRTVGINPLVTLLAITAFGSVLGLAGAVLAIPLAAIAQLLLDRLLLGRGARSRRAPAGRDRLSAVRYAVEEVALDVRKLQRLREGAGNPAERIEDAVEAIAADLDRLLGGVERRRGRRG
jgi:predicted PurR-regulated permease PerM